MANYKVAYGKKENMNLAIELGIIPPGSIILTENSSEIFFYTLDKEIKPYEEKYKFESYEEATEWLESYGCQGQIFSIHENDRCNLYSVGYDNKLHRVSGADYVVSEKDPATADNAHEILTHWINIVSEEVFILISVKEGIATWKRLMSGDYTSSFKFTQSVAEKIWMIEHNLDKYPSVTTVDDDSQIIIGEVTYMNSNSLLVKFTHAVSGQAYLN